MGQVETFEFQAEAQQLLQLMIHSVYANKDVFLRELVSNASDALDKLRLQSMIDKDLDADTGDLRIELAADPAQRTLTVRDNGIGMTRDQVIELIGTIARSGTAEFVTRWQQAKQDGTAELIGKFGIGFYSSFMVADRVVMITRRAGETEATRWESTGTGTYEISTVADADPGTAVTLHLKPADEDDQLHDYTDPAVLRRIVKRYSDFIAWPIRMSEPDTDQPATLNSMKALWSRPAADIKPDEYTEFYRHVSHDWTDPLETIHLRAEGALEFDALLFLPTRAPYDLFSRDARRGVQLYIKRVFIMDDCQALLPEYLRFVKGVVDSADLSLNVSREILQQDRQIQTIHRRLVKKVLGTLKDMLAKDPERYTGFWREFGQAVKEGLINDPDNRAAILDVVQLASTGDPARPTTLREYVERMNPDQTEIFYLVGEQRTTLENSPHLEAFTANGVEVLLLHDPVDAMWVELVGDYDGKPFASASRGEVDLKTPSDQAPDAGDYAELLAWMGARLGEKVKQVRLSTRLTTSAACLVSDAFDAPPALEKLYRAMGQDLPKAKRILELNPQHPLVDKLRAAHAERGDDDTLAETAELLHAMAVLAEGGELDDPAGFTRRLADRLARTL
ncbi:molecular chaperone HtpG [Catellatospora citrea]|uniref:Chaperone protein HtpG n=1 Tax=Catellatospora citrea TaxID=53366 RepID=A0A8J3KJF1_9ACTN|nr:molecular chaperone HtpG [Catellatospora citrea]RKE05369.1 molecular chaperone HtpG [Catellatospora citrea]GIF98298.1 chaperone protein HtpG [Catellatospora citrea]